MTDRDLRKLSRSDLLDLLLSQTKELEILRAELEEANQRLEERSIILQEAGSIAEASLQLNGVFAAAENACAQYMENIKNLSQRQEAICREMELETKRKCDQMVTDAQRQADAYWVNVSRKVDSLFDSYSGLRDLLTANPRTKKQE